MPARAAVETARYQKRQACLRRLPRPAVPTVVWWDFGGESPQGDLGAVAREFIRRAERRGGSTPAGLSLYSARLSRTVVLLMLLHVPFHAKPLLSNALLRELGTISYSLYLVHLPMLAIGLRALQLRYPGVFQGWGIPAIVAVTLIACACVVLATISYWAIERPFLKLKTRVDRS